jgi:hypothetical protein
MLLYGLIAVPLVIFVLKKMFPEQAKRMQQKFIAFTTAKCTHCVHNKCLKQKAELFKALEKTVRP